MKRYNVIAKYTVKLTVPNPMPNPEAGRLLAEGHGSSPRVAAMRAAEKFIGEHPAGGTAVFTVYRNR